MGSRYITIHDDRIPFPVKEFVVPIEEDGSYVDTVEKVCEALDKIDDIAERPSKSMEIFYREEA